MPLSIFKRLGLGEARPTTITLQLADKSLKHPIGVIEDVKVDKFIFPADFIVLDMEEDKEIPIILGRLFLATGRAMIDVQRGELKLRVQEDEVKFNVFEAVRHPVESDKCFMAEIVEAIVSSQSGLIDPLEASLVQNDSKNMSEEAEEYVKWMDSFGPNRRKYFESLNEGAKTPVPSIEQPPKMEQKPLPSHLKYAYLGIASTLPVIISSSLTELEEEKLLRVLRDHKNALGWSLADLKGIRPSMCMHRILLEDGHKPSVEAQMRLNPTMKEVVQKEVLKWLYTGVIYPISDSAWVSPVQVVPKKGGTTIIRTENNILLLARTVTRWRICIDYRKLNKATRKDHFSLSFLDQMMDRLAGHEYYYFLDGYSCYNQIAITPEDQEKTTFTCPYGHKPSVEAQRRLNPTMKEVVRKEVLKWLDTEVIYPISDSAWVSPVQVLPKKGGTTVIRTENNILLPSRTVTGWRIFIDYRKLNKATRKYNFPLSFLDQMLDRLAGHEYYCFLDGYSGYNQIAIAPEDQERRLSHVLMGHSLSGGCPLGYAMH